MDNARNRQGIDDFLNCKALRLYCLKQTPALFNRLAMLQLQPIKLLGIYLRLPVVLSIFFNLYLGHSK